MRKKRTKRKYYKTLGMKWFRFRPINVIFKLL